MAKFCRDLFISDTPLIFAKDIFRKASSTATNNKGFAIALILALLPTLIGVVLVTFAIVSFVQVDTRIKYACRNTLIDGQARVGVHLEKLLAMNKEAEALRAKLIAARARVVASAGSPSAIAALEAIEIKIQVFIAKQQQLITQSNLQMVKSQSQARSQILNEGRKSLSTIPLFTYELSSSMVMPKTLAVRPVGFEPPTYSPVEGFAEAQTLEQIWQYRLKVVPTLSPFLSGDYHFQEHCGVSLQEQELRWVPLIKKDKSLSKRL